MHDARRIGLSSDFTYMVDRPEVFTKEAVAAMMKRCHQYSRRCRKNLTKVGRKGALHDFCGFRFKSAVHSDLKSATIPRSEAGHRSDQ